MPFKFDIHEIVRRNKNKNDNKYIGHIKIRWESNNTLNRYIVKFSYGEEVIDEYDLIPAKIENIHDILKIG